MKEGKEEKEKEKKSNSLLVTILILLLMVACVAGGYLIAASQFIKTKPLPVEDKKDEVPEEMEKQESKVTEYSPTDEKVSHLIDNLVTGMNCFILENEYANNQKVTANDVSNQRAYYIASRTFYPENPDSISLEDFTKAVQSKLGKDYVFNPANFNSNDQECPSYRYNASTKTFEKQETACGGTCGPMTTYKIVKAVDVDGLLTLDVKVLFAKDAYYSDYDKTHKVVDLLDYSELEPYYSQGGDYKFTFKLEDGNYVFVSSEPVNS